MCLYALMPLLLPLPPIQLLLPITTTTTTTAAAAALLFLLLLRGLVHRACVASVVSLSTALRIGSILPLASSSEPPPPSSSFVLSRSGSGSDSDTLRQSLRQSQSLRCRSDAQMKAGGRSLVLAALHREREATTLAAARVTATKSAPSLHNNHSPITAALHKANAIDDSRARAREEEIISLHTRRLFAVEV